MITAEQKRLRNNEASRKHRAKYPNCRKEENQKYRKQNSSRSRFKLYGVTQDQFDFMLEAQGGLCAVCCEPMKPGKQTHIDHDHLTGEVRGLLCHGCNIALGCFLDDGLILLNAADYVRRC